MKKLSYLLLILISFSCAELAPLNEIPEVNNLFSIDLKKYSEDGFLITQDKYIKEYESIAMIDFLKRPKASYVKVGRKINNSASMSANTPVYEDEMSWIVGEISMQETIDNIYEICKSMGADALVDFKIASDDFYYSSIKNPILVPGYRITGFAIKRK